jgi:hypothetical protein
MAARNNISDAQMREILEEHAQRSGTRLHEDGSISLPGGHRVPGANHFMFIGEDGTELDSHIPNERRGLAGVSSYNVRGGNTPFWTVSNVGTTIGPAYGDWGTQVDLTHDDGSPLPNARELAQKHLDSPNTVGNSSEKHIRELVRPRELERLGPEDIAAMSKDRHLVSTTFHDSSSGTRQLRKFNLKTGFFEQD